MCVYVLCCVLCLYTAMHNVTAQLMNLMRLMKVMKGQCSVHFTALLVCHTVMYEHEKYDRELNLGVGNFLRKLPNVTPSCTSLYKQMSMLIALVMCMKIAHRTPHPSRGCIV